MSDDDSCSSCEMMIDIGGAEDDFDEEEEEEEEEKERTKEEAKQAQVNTYKAFAAVSLNETNRNKASSKISNQPCQSNSNEVETQEKDKATVVSIESVEASTTGASHKVEETFYTPFINSIIMDTGKYACSVECCNSSHHSDAIVIGTYQLDEEHNRRDGNIQLYNYASESKVPKLHQTLEMPYGGVLDCKWNPEGINDSEPLLACACASGALTLVTLNSEWRDIGQNKIKSNENGENTSSSASTFTSSIRSSNSSIAMDDSELLPLKIKASTADPTGYLFLSLDWNNKKQSPTAYDGRDSGGGSGGGGGGVGVKIACSESKGSVSVWDVETLLLHKRWSAHELCGEPSECWCVSFDDWDPNMLYSGADDGILKVWDLRQQSCTSSSGKGDGQVGLSTSLLHKHDAGVTSICFSPFCEFYFATGSYDGKVRLFDKRKLNSDGVVSTHCQALNSVDLGGGIWRMKWNKALNELCVASMHSGVHVLSCPPLSQASSLSSGSFKQFDGSELPSFNVKLRYDKHKSMAYGADWCHNGEGIVSCSFYDHGAHFWTVPEH